MPDHDDPPDQDDAALFRAAIGPVRSMPQQPAPVRPPPPRPRARMREADEHDARSDLQRLLQTGGDALEAGDPLRYRRDAVAPRILKRLAQGQFAAQDELDLHGLDARQAESLLRAFLKQALHDGLGCVRIIHGKGRGSDASIPVLKNQVDRLLRQRADVLAFHSAPAAQGGTGAVLVLLQTRQR